MEETLLQGQKKIEEAKVQTYWMTGKIIHTYILRFQSRGERYGEETVAKLSEDLSISRDVLWRCVQFAKSFKILAAQREFSAQPLSWAHYKELITIPDEEMRLAFKRRAEKAGWGYRKLSQKIREEVKTKRKVKVEEESHTSFPKLIPKKGELYTYRLIETDPLHKKYTESLRIDVGFKDHRQLPDSVKNLKAGQIIESVKNEKGDYEVSPSKRKDTALFTYKAYVERVIDGDTLYVDIDLGFKMGIYQYLRLRGINCPEIDAPEGKKAKAFVERELAKVPYITLTSSRSDKYDRYLADVFYGGATGDEIYLNQRLLDEGLAERMG